MPGIPRHDAQSQSLPWICLAFCDTVPNHSHSPGYAWHSATRCPITVTPLDMPGILRHGAQSKENKYLLKAFACAMTEHSSHHASDAASPFLDKAPWFHVGIPAGA